MYGANEKLFSQKHTFRQTDPKKKGNISTPQATTTLRFQTCANDRQTIFLILTFCCLDPQS